MATSSSSSVCARFDQFQVDLSSGDLRTSEGTSVRIQQQPLQVLRLLLAAEGRVVTRSNCVSLCGRTIPSLTSSMGSTRP